MAICAKKAAVGLHITAPATLLLQRLIQGNVQYCVHIAGRGPLGAAQWWWTGPTSSGLTRVPPRATRVSSLLQPKRTHAPLPVGSRWVWRSSQADQGVVAREGVVLVLHRGLFARATRRGGPRNQHMGNLTLTASKYRIPSPPAQPAGRHGWTDAKPTFASPQGASLVRAAWKRPW